MARLPQPGGDQGNWGNLLNDFLLQAHDSAGTLKPNSVGSSQLQPSAITTSIIADGTISEAKLDSATQAKLNSASPTIPDGSITKAKLATAVQTSLDKADTALQTAPVTSVAAKTGAVTLVKGDVGLSNIDNTSDTNKPISAATQTALNAKAPIANPNFQGSASVTGGSGGADLYIDAAPGNWSTVYFRQNNQAGFDFGADDTMFAIGRYPTL